MTDLDEPSESGRLSGRQFPFQILGIHKLAGNEARLGAGVAEARYESTGKRSLASALDAIGWRIVTLVYSMAASHRTRACLIHLYVLRRMQVP